MKITVIRHTSVAVSAGYCYGTADVPLAETARAEMQEVLNELIGRAKLRTGNPADGWAERPTEHSADTWAERPADGSADGLAASSIEHLSSGSAASSPKHPAGASDSRSDGSLRTVSSSFDAVFCSPLSRCRKLAQFLLPDTDIQVDDRLLELHFGRWEMSSWDSIYQSAEGKRWFENFLHSRCPDGENYHDMTMRIKRFLEDLQSEKHQHVLLITHAGVIRILRHLIDHVAPEDAFRSPLAYGEICTFELTDPKNTQTEP